MSQSPRKMRHVSDVTELTIDELAREAGMTVRNVRAHQSRGLLPPPEIRGRTGYYGPAHLSRLELVKELQADGLNLEAIRRIVESTPGDSSQMLDFTRAVTTPFSEERPEVIGLDELLEPWGEERVDSKLARRVQRLGFVQPLGGERFEVRSPRLREASRELAELGVPMRTAIEIVIELQRHSEAIAKAYVRLFLETVWRPFQEESGPEDDESWAEMREALQRLRPLATQSLVAVFQMVMTDTVEEALGRELGRIGEGKGKR